MDRHLKGYPFIGAAVFLWGTQGSFGKIVMDAGVGPVTLAAGRISFGAMAFLLLILLHPAESLRIRKGDFPYFVVFGLATVGLLHGSFNLAIYHTGVGTASILLYTAPAFVTVLSIFFFGETPTLRRIIALLVTLAGCVAITSAVDTLLFNRIGVLFGLLAGFAYGLWNVLNKKGLVRYSPAVLNFYSMLVGGIVLLIASFQISGSEMFRLSPGIWGAMVLMAIAHSFLPNSFYVKALHYMRPSRASIMANGELIISVLLAWILFREPFTLLKTAGFVLVTAGIILIATEEYIHEEEHLPHP